MLNLLDVDLTFALSCVHIAEIWIYTAVSRKVLGKRVRDNTEMIYGWWLLTVV